MQAHERFNFVVRNDDPGIPSLSEAQKQMIRDAVAHVGFHRGGPVRQFGVQPAKRAYFRDEQQHFVMRQFPKPRLVIIESPFSPSNGHTEKQNKKYARRCMLDSLNRNEAPYASHLLYTQVLDDATPAERKQGMEAGFAWGAVAQHVAVYTDLGISQGMIEGIKRHQVAGKTIEFREIGK